MASLPKHLTATPTLLHADIHLTIDGGDIRDKLPEIFGAMEVACEEMAHRFGLELCIERKFISTDSRRLRRQLRTRGFQVPLEPPRSQDAVRLSTDQPVVATRDK